MDENFKQLFKEERAKFGNFPNPDADFIAHERVLKRQKQNENEKIKWLEQTGYEFDAVLERYWFKYADGQYRAVISWSMAEVMDIPFLHLKILHDKFMARAENKETF